MKQRLLIALVAVAVACSKSKAPPANVPPPPAPGPAVAAATPVAGANTCPGTGLWAQCSLVYRLERAGLAPHVDSSAAAEERTLTGKPLVITLGRTTHLEVFFYPDSAARIADERNLDRSQFVNGTAPQTIKRERTLIESANVAALLTSINAHQRERVSDAITAGPPQPDKP